MRFLGKINQAVYIDDMYKNEYLYFSSLLEMRNCPDDGSGRKDPKELNIRHHQIGELIIEKDGISIPFHSCGTSFSGQLMFQINKPVYNCCSMHLIEIELDMPSSSYNDELLLLGEKTLLIFDIDQFLFILDKSIENAGYNWERARVDYYDPKTYDGGVSLHQKDCQYYWQNEYRILIYPTSNEPIKIPVPGLRKISRVLDTHELKNVRVRNEADSFD